MHPTPAVFLLLGSLALASCTKKTTVSIVESLEVTILEKKTEVTEYEATLESRGPTPEGDSLGWTVRRITPDGMGSPYDVAVMSAKRRMELGMVKLPNQCLKFGDGITALRASLIVEAMDALDGGEGIEGFSKDMIKNYVAIDPAVSSLMAAAPGDLLLLSGLSPGRHDSLLMPHPYYAGIPLAYSLDLAPVDGVLEGSVHLDSAHLAAMPAPLVRQMGHVGRFVRRNTDPSQLELTVVDTFIVPESFFSREEKRVLKRIYRADLPLL